MCFYFINQLLCALYTAFNKCFYTCDVVVVKSLYITFQLKEQFAFQIHALGITTVQNWAFGEHWADCSLVKFRSFSCIVS